MSNGIMAVSKPVAIALLMLCLAGVGPAGLSAESQEERIEELEMQIEELRQQLAQYAEGAAGDARLAEIERRIELLAMEIERLKIGEAAAQADQPQYGFGPAASKIYRTQQGISFGGYGEMLYESFDSRADDGSPAPRRDQLDFLRAIFYIGYKFNDRWLFNSEIEFEHATTGESGEASVEFAYLDYLARPQLNARFGLLLIPMGLVNELHEPTVFLGARRPSVERFIIPSTWRENGLGIFGDAGPVTYRAYLVNGLDAAGFSAAGLRGGRQRGSRALAEDFALVGRVDYTGSPGLLLGGSVYLGDSGQGLTDGAGRRIAVGTRIFEAHAEWTWRGLEVGGLFARAALDDVARLNGALGLAGGDSIGEELDGYYLQASYDVLARRGGEAALFPYVRYESYDTQSQVPSGFARDPAREVESLTIGIAYQPLDRLIFKLDYEDQDNRAGTAVDQLNVAIGYVF